METKIKVGDDSLEFRVDSPIAEYCGMCQQLGEPQYGAPKVNRNLPLFTYNVEGTHSSENKSKWVVLCSDCIMDAHFQKWITVLNPDRTPFSIETADMMFVRWNMASYHERLDQQN